MTEVFKKKPDQNKILLVFALSDEAGPEFNAYDQLICGIGKVSAAYALTKSIAASRPDVIINLGSAGSSRFDRGEVVCCTRFVQRDMDARGLGFARFETPLSGIPAVLSYGIAVEQIPVGICGTGDSFEMEHDSAHYDVVDMEAYSLALIAMKEDIPFLCLKYISDGADATAAVDWSEGVHLAASALKAVLTQRVFNADASIV